MHLRKAFAMILMFTSYALASAQALTTSQCPNLALGADVSFMQQAETQGSVFRLNGKPTEGLSVLRNNGYNWVRLRLFVNPDTTVLPNNLAYTIAEAQKAKALGYNFLLDLHYSDTWADPGHQNMPAAWRGMSHADLINQVYNYTRDTIKAFRTAGVQPDMVQLGNEVSNGILWPDGQLPYNWSNFLDLIRAGEWGIQAATSVIHRPLIMIHDDQGANMYATEWFFDHLVAANVPFDVIGLSYYPWWQGSLTDLQTNLNASSTKYWKPVIVVEAAYSWQTDNYAVNAGPYPETPLGQQSFLQGVAQAVANTNYGLGGGVFWWEPAVNDPALEKRALFDPNGNPLPALNVFDACVGN
jgi:arabinogalactan endo-1,4-beta-galactosidase